jgi:hypothetical protein
VASDYDQDFIYNTGDWVRVANYDNNAEIICAPGIHYYLTSVAAYIHWCYLYNYNYFSRDTTMREDGSFRIMIHTYEHTFQDYQYELKKLLHKLTVDQLLKNDYCKVILLLDLIEE